MKLSKHLGGGSLA